MKGKFALVLQGTSSTLVKAEQAKQAGAVGVLFISTEKKSILCQNILCVKI